MGTDSPIAMKIPSPHKAWLVQSIAAMKKGISQGKTRRRKVATVRRMNISEAELKAATRQMGWKLAQVGDDYVFAPGNYSIRPIV